MPLKTQPLEIPTLNLTPMIDVLFQLIIFFMVGTQFVGMDQQIEVEVPRVGPLSASTPSTQHHVVVLSHDGTIYLDGGRVSLAELRQRLTEASGSAPASVLVVGDRKGQVQHLADVLQACSSAGISNLGVAVRPRQLR